MNTTLPDFRATDQTLTTGGDGHWSNESREVRVTGLRLHVYEIDSEGIEEAHGELHVKFDTASWDTSIHGLIYTDKKFIIELSDFLHRSGYDVTDMGYSEYGMQGDDYISLDVGSTFINSWNATK